MGMNGLLEIGKKGVLAHQSSIAVAGHNIANVNTPGYSRQEAVLATTKPQSAGAGQVGTGVFVTTIRRDYDIFINEQLIQEGSGLGELSSRESALSKVEMLFNDESGVGLNDNINRFFSSLHDLAANPTGYVERSSVKSRGDILAGTINSLSSNLKDLRAGLDEEIKGTVQEINILTSRIAELNENILHAESGTMVANDYRDERSQLMRELSGKIDISFYEAEDGRVAIQGKGGFLLVQANRSYELDTATNLEGHVDLFSIGLGGSSVNITSMIGSGELGGLVDVRDKDIPGYMTKVDELAYTLTVEVNNLHSSAYALDGVTTGLNFFADLSGLVSPPGGAAEQMTLSADIIDPASIAAALSPASPGDNGNALAMADLQSLNLLSGGTATFDGFYNGLAADIGVDLNSASSRLSHQENMIRQLEMRREFVSGVSLDEEMADLVRFQHAYEASARLISIADEMLETIIGLVR